MSIRTKITGVLVCGIVAVALASLGFSRAVLMALVEDSGLGGGEQSMLAVALAGFVMPFVMPVVRIG